MFGEWSYAVAFAKVFRNLSDLSELNKKKKRINTDILPVRILFPDSCSLTVRFQSLIASLASKEIKEIQKRNNSACISIQPPQEEAPDEHKLGFSE